MQLEELHADVTRAAFPITAAEIGLRAAAAAAVAKPRNAQQEAGGEANTGGGGWGAASTGGGGGDADSAVSGASKFVTLRTAREFDRLAALRLRYFWATGLESSWQIGTELARSLAALGMFTQASAMYEPPCVFFPKNYPPP
jgi:hypothetical protein